MPRGGTLCLRSEPHLSTMRKRTNVTPRGPATNRHIRDDSHDGCADSGERARERSDADEAARARPAGPHVW